MAFHVRDRATDAAVRRLARLTGKTLTETIREAVEREFLSLNEREQSVRSVMAKMESGFIRRLAEFHRD